MPERATVFNTVQIGLETTPGTNIAANKLLASLDFGTGIKAQNKLFKPAGRKFASFVVPGKEWVEAKLSGQATYGEVIYPLCGILKKVTPTTDTVVAKLWTMAPALNAEDTVATYSVEQGSATRAHEFSYGLVNDYTLKFSREGVEHSGTMIGQALVDPGTMSAGATAVETTPIPIAGDDISVYLADSWALLSSASAATRVLSAEWSIAGRFGQVWALDSSQASFAALAELAPKVTLKLQMEADATGMGLLPLMRQGTQKWVRIKCAGANIAGETAKPYMLQLDGCYGVMEPSEMKDQDGVYAIEWTLNANYDPTVSKTIEAQVRNLVSAL
jgi:hypothetical protein